MDVTKKGEDNNKTTAEKNIYKGQDRGNFQLIFRIDGNENINWKCDGNGENKSKIPKKK